jgi:Putative GTPase activating protein for Arf/PH domain
LHQTDVSVLSDDEVDSGDEVGGTIGRSRSATAALISSMKKRTDKKDMKDRALLNSLLFTLTPLQEGYLQWKHVKSHRWKRRWAIMTDAQLYLFKSTQDPRDPVVVPLIGACVRPVPLKQTTFQVLAVNNTHTFQVESSLEMYEWVTRLGEVCERLVMTSIDADDEQRFGGGADYGSDGDGDGRDDEHGRARGDGDATGERDGDGDGERAGGSGDDGGLKAAAQRRKERKDADPFKEAVCAMQRLEGNQTCADCSRFDPEWVSTNLGVFICIDCSGTHRRMGTHISKVRSLRLDKWLPEHLDIVRVTGNVKANKQWEHNSRGVAKPTPQTSADEREAYIRMKYQQGRFRKDADVYAASQRAITLTGEGLKHAILHLLRVDMDFRKQVRQLLLHTPDDESTDDDDDAHQENSRAASSQQ